MIRFGFSDWTKELHQNLQIAAWLHDILEDTTLSEEGLRRKFGDTITDLVVAVTNKPGRNRMERHAATYPKIRANPTAVILKLADRIVNVEASLLNRGSKTHLLEVYREEHPGFEGGLGRGEERDPRCSNMWTHLASMIYR